MAKLGAKRVVTPEDLESLVRALGGLVRESVCEEVKDQLKPLVEKVHAMSRELEVLKTLDASVNRCEGVIRDDLPKVITQELDRNRTRVIADMKRDYEHRVYLGEIDAVRHPERFGASSLEIAAARVANLKAAIAHESKSGNYPDEPPMPQLIDGEAKKVS